MPSSWALQRCPRPTYHGRGSAPSSGLTRPQGIPRVPRRCLTSRTLPCSCALDAPLPPPRGGALGEELRGTSAPPPLPKKPRDLRKGGFEGRWLSHFLPP